MIDTEKIGYHYGKNKPYNAKQALKCERMLSWSREQVLDFLKGFGKGRKNK